MNIFAAILICASSVPIQARDESTALSVIFGQSVYSQPDQCQIELLAYVANSGLVHKGDVVKVYCGPRQQIFARFSSDRDNPIHVG